MAKRVSGVPFPYVVLGGPENVSEKVIGHKEPAVQDLENQRAWFVAHVELSTPRWNNAREALVRSLAISESDTAAAPLKEDAEWDGGVAVPAPAADQEATPAPIKLRAKRRAPTLDTSPSIAMPDAPASVEMMSDPGEVGIPLLAEGLAPLVPLPMMTKENPPAVALRVLDPVIAQTSTVRRTSDGRVKKAVGMVLLCGLLGTAGFLLFKEFAAPAALKTNLVASTAPASVPAELVARPVPVAPAVSSTPSSVAASVAASAAETRTEGVAANAPAGPVQASPAFAHYVTNLRVSGVSLGASPRALINGRMVHVGDLLDGALGVRLVAVESDSRQLVFEDATTARLRARY